jgi:hypothetical protein
MKLAHKKELLQLFKNADKVLKTDRNWCKQSFLNRNRYCLMGAMYRPTLTKQDLADGGDVGMALGNVAGGTAFFNKFDDWISYHITKPRGSQRDSSLTEFNDDPKTTFKDVKKAIKEAIRILKLQIANGAKTKAA